MLTGFPRLGFILLPPQDRHNTNTLHGLGPQQFDPISFFLTSTPWTQIFHEINCLRAFTIHSLTTRKRPSQFEEKGHAYDRGFEIPAILLRCLHLLHSKYLILLPPSILLP